MLMNCIHTFNGDESVVTKYEQCVLVERPRQPVSEAVTKFRTNAKTAIRWYSFLWSAIELQAQNLWGITGFEPAFPDLKTDQLTAVLSLGPSANNRRVARNKTSDDGTT